MYSSIKNFKHCPVMYKEVMAIIQKYKPNNILDCTLGLGGHSKGILKLGELTMELKEANLELGNCKLTAIDCDPNTNFIAGEISSEFPERFTFYNNKFSEAIKKIAATIKDGEKFQCVLADFGLSSFQIDDVTRGFSYEKNCNLSMSMCEKTSHRCEYIVNQSTLAELAKVIRLYGEDRCYYHIAKAIIDSRPIKSTKELRTAIESAIKLPDFLRIKTVARVFQAIRIYTNEELEEIRFLLSNMDKITDSNTIFIFIYFHSLEGKEVFEFLKARKKKFPLHSEFLTPSKEEVKHNSRSRSARMVILTPLAVV